MTKLGDVCEYRSESVTVQEAASMPLYISTDSMQPNRGPVSSSALPDTGKVKRFEAGDTLVSNIRPYFKKIWHAEVNGTCSNDILVFRPVGCTPSFLFWTLNSDEFFAYVTKTAKGTKMPRGDKRAIMEYAVQVPLEDEQRSLCQIMNSLQEKIALNNRTNDYLEELLLAKYDKLFGAFEQATCTGTLADIGEVVGGATPSKKRSDYYCHGGIGWITPRDLSNSTNKFIAHGADDITNEGYASCSARLMPKGSVLFSSRAPIGYIAIATNELTTNQGFKSVIPLEQYGTAFVYCFLKKNKNRISDMGAGTTFPEVSGKAMKRVGLKIPSADLCAEFSTFANPLLGQQRTNEEENRKLEALRDSLLPKLMSGEIDVSNIDFSQLNNHLSDC